MKRIARFMEEHNGDAAAVALVAGVIFIVYLLLTNGSAV